MIFGGATSKHSVSLPLATDRLPEPATVEWASTPKLELRVVGNPSIHCPPSPDCLRDWLPLSDRLAAENWNWSLANFPSPIMLSEDHFSELLNKNFLVLPASSLTFHLGYVWIHVSAPRLRFPSANYWDPRSKTWKREMDFGETQLSAKLETQNNISNASFH